MSIVHANLATFFHDLLSDIKCRADTKAYIVSIYEKYKTAQFDLSKDSVTLLYAQACNKQDFLTYQNLGDWIFFTNTLIDSNFRYASKDYYDTIARHSYYACYRLINKQWFLFEELSDNFITLEYQVKNKLKDIAINK